jgi:hypothetical protein
MTDLVYELLSHVVKNTNITINFNVKQLPNEDTESTPSDCPPTISAPVAGLARADLIQLIKALEDVSSALKKINMSLVGAKQDEVTVMLNNFNKILNSAKMIVNAV